MTIKEKIEKLIGDKPNTLSVSFNEHWTCYESIGDTVSRIDSDDFISEEDRQKCLATNSLWCVAYYPNSPVGHIAFYASDLDLALDALLKELNA